MLPEWTVGKYIGASDLVLATGSLDNFSVMTIGH